jgi:multiple sugar transport system substrate-binding protein
MARPINKAMCTVFLVVAVLFFSCDSRSEDMYNKYMNDINSIEEPRNYENSAALSGEITVETFHHEYMEKLAESFMILNPDIKINVNVAFKTMNLMMDVNDFQNAFLSYNQRIAYELMSGTLSADIIDLENLAVYRYGRTGLLCDINFFMDNDVSFNRKEYYNNIFEAMEYEEKLYSLPFGFSYDTIFLNKKALELSGQRIEAFSSLNYKELLDVYYRVTDTVRDIKSFPLSYVTYRNKNFAANQELVNFYDIYKKTASFDSVDFADYLETTNVPTYFDAFEYYDSNMENDMFMCSFSCASIDEVHESIFDVDNAIGPILYANTKGRNIFSILGANYGISANSKNSALCWEFLKFCISEKSVETLQANRDDIEVYSQSIAQIPININNFYNYSKSYTQKISNSQKIRFGFKYDSKEESIAKSLEYFNKWNLEKDTMSIDSELIAIVSDFTQKYYNNYASKEEVGLMLQERIMTYLIE